MRPALVPAYGAGATIRASPSSRATHSPATVPGDFSRLLERTDELAVVDDALRAARAGTGAMLLVEGPPGIGKSELLATAAARGRQGQMLVLSARGGELERSFPHALARQLFEPAVARANPATRHRLLSGAAAHARTVVDPRADPGPSRVDRSAVLHGLYWLTANLAADRPVLLVVDDLHWGDPESVGWLTYLARRIEGLAVGLVLGARSIEPGADDGLLEDLRATDGLARLEPAPLSLAAVDHLARSALGEAVQQAFVAGCHAATQGNPFYVVELLRAVRHDHAADCAAGMQAIDGLTPRVVVDATLARLGRLPSEVHMVAEAVALLEPSAETRRIAELTGLDMDVVANAADALLDLGMLRSVAPCRFEHPILRSAVESAISPARHHRLRLQAARAFAAAGLPVEEVAAHLMLTAPTGEPWVVSTLAQAARAASARGAPGGAVSYLQRALAERPQPDERRELLLALGSAESQIQMPGAPGHLRDALELAEYADHAAVAALALGQALFSAGAIDEAYEIVSDVVERTDGHQGRTMLELRAFLISIAGPAGRIEETAERAAALEACAPANSPAKASLQAGLALRALVAGHPRGAIRERAERAVADHAGSRGSSSRALGRAAPGMAFLWIDDLDRAEELFTEAIKDASALGRRRAFENLCALRGYAARRRGNLADAAADVEPILETAVRGETPGTAALLALITRVLLLVDQGLPETAERLALLAPVPSAFERLPIVAMLRHAQAVTALAQRRPGVAAATLMAVGEVCEATGIRSPAVIPWRSDLALALAGTDRHDEAVELARTELRLAEQCDVDRARGLALRALGLLAGGPVGLQHLEAAVDAFERSQARLELAWARHELGAALRRANRRRDARAPLDLALDCALSCGARLLAERCNEELKALGARPRSAMVTGADALTASERRVCRLASEGTKNRDIAQALFVSLRTVETHLNSAYRKLDISSRSELSRALLTSASSS